MSQHPQENDTKKQAQKLPTIDDVAKLAGVSTATVSRCLNAPDQVRQSTRERVDSAIARLGYTPNFGGRVLASNRTGTVGVVIPTMDNAIFAEAMQSMEQVLAKRGITLFISSSQYQPDREEAQIRTLLSRGVDGLVLIGSETRPNVDDLIKKRGLPCVNLWTAKPFGGRVTIGFNNESAARDAAERVFKLGHRKIAFLAGLTQGNGRAAGRMRGVSGFLKSAGAPIDKNWVRETSYSFDNGKKAVESWLSEADRPTVILCGNDVLAIGALMAAREAGLDVPQDLSVVGFDDLDISHAISPSLTTVRVPHKRMGNAAADALIEWLDTGKQPDDQVISPQFMMRESLGPPPR